jgi:hypothetical protein
MTDYVVCPACETALTSAICNTCGARSSAAPVVPFAPTRVDAPHYTGVWQRFLIASIPASILALFVESTLSGYLLYLGIYLMYCVWGEAMRPLDKRETDSQQQTAGQRLTANS